MKKNKIMNAIQNAFSKIKSFTFKSMKKCKQFGFIVTGEILKIFGKTKIDDEILIAIITSIIFSSMKTNPNITESQISSILNGVFDYIDTKQIEVGTKLIEKGKK